MFFVALSRLSSTNSQDYPSLFCVWDAAEDWSMWRGQRSRASGPGPRHAATSHSWPTCWLEQGVNVNSFNSEIIAIKVLKVFISFFVHANLTSTFQNGTWSNVGNIAFVSLPFPRPCWWLMCLVLEGCLLVFFWECIWHRIGHWLPKINS